MSSASSSSSSNSSSSTSSSSSLVSSVLHYITSQNPSFRDAHDAVMFALHSHMVTNRCFQLVSINDSSPDLSSSTTTSTSLDGWNRSSDAYSFTYTHPNSPITATSSPTSPTLYILKALRMDSSLLLHATTKPSSTGTGVQSMD